MMNELPPVWSLPNASRTGVGKSPIIFWQNLIDKNDLLLVLGLPVSVRENITVARVLTQGHILPLFQTDFAVLSAV